MSEEELALAERALGEVSGEAIVAVTRRRTLRAAFAGTTSSRPEVREDIEIQALAIRDGQTALAAVSAGDPDSVRATVRRAEADAEALARAEGSGPYPGAPGPGTPPPAHDGWDADTATLPAPPPPEPTGLATGAWHLAEERTAVVSSAGLAVVDRTTAVHLEVRARADGQRPGDARATAVALGTIDVTAICARALGAATGDEPADAPAGEVRAVLSPRAVADLLLALGATAFNGLAHAEGRGALTGKLGTRVAAPSINLSDSPRYGASLPRAFDAEGMAKAPLPLLQDGVAHRVVHDARSAAIAGDAAASTGHALTPGGDESGPGPGHLVLVGGGATDEDELMAPVEHGVYLTALGPLMPGDPSQSAVAARAEGFAIEGGRRAAPLRGLMLADSILRLLGNVEALSSRSTFQAAGRRFVAGAVAPAIRVSSLHLAPPAGGRAN